MGWVAELQTGTQRFELVADRGYIEIYELGDDEHGDKHRHQIGPTLEQIDTATPGIISRVLCNTAPPEQPEAALDGGRVKLSWFQRLFGRGLGH